MVDLQNHFRSGKVSPPMPSFSLSLIPHHYPAGKVIKSCSKTPAHLYLLFYDPTICSLTLIIFVKNISKICEKFKGDISCIYNNNREPFFFTFVNMEGVCMGKLTYLEWKMKIRIVKAENSEQGSILGPLQRPTVPRNRTFRLVASQKSRN